jgi:TPR repeat protein
MQYRFLQAGLLILPLVAVLASPTLVSAAPTPPRTIRECENGPKGLICGQWVWNGHGYNAAWDNGVTATIAIDQWSDTGLVLHGTSITPAGFTVAFNGALQGSGGLTGQASWKTAQMAYPATTSWTGTFNQDVSSVPQRAGPVSAMTRVAVARTQADHCDAEAAAHTDMPTAFHNGRVALGTPENQTMWNDVLIVDAKKSSDQDADFRAAGCWFMRAAEQGNARAMAAIASMMHDGHGFDQDDGEAFSWAQKSAAASDHMGEAVLASFYQHGYGVAANQAEAQKWAQKSKAQYQAIQKAEQQQNAAEGKALMGLLGAAMMMGGGNGDDGESSSSQQQGSTPDQINRAQMRDQYYSSGGKGVSPY